jgi:hypothetical protein
VGSIASISSFGEDATGNLYVLDLNGGEVFLIPEPAVVLQLATGFLALVGLRQRQRSCAPPPESAHSV